MKCVRYLFFNIYNWYYKDGIYNRKIDPCDMAIYMFSLGTSFWLILILNVYSNIIYGSNLSYNKSYKIYYAITPVLAYVFYNNYFYFSDRYARIYNQFKDFSKTNINKKRDLIISFTILLVPFPIIAFWAVLSKIMGF